MSIPTRPQLVHIKLSRVQTWLFAVPHLRAMVGANALLGEALRVQLRDLARATDRGWSLAPSEDPYPAAHENDPLKEDDNPAEDAKDGILSRDGGHFEAQFSKGAKAFTEAAAQLLRENVPGLRFHISIDGEQQTTNQVHLSTELPVLERCRWTGHGLASDIVRQGTEPHLVSLDVVRRHEAAKRTEDRTAVDIASLLIQRTRLRTLERPQELSELVGDKYLALVHADGNGVGEGLRKDGHRTRAEFFHRNRVLLRRAVHTAIERHCPAEGTAPLIPLMLGGDDLLLVCRAEVALPFVVTLCEALDELQRDDRGFKLTLGVGVVFAKHTIPTYRLHEVAEQLASSAKRRYRGLGEGRARSVIDWAVFRTAWVDDPAEVRPRDWLRSGDDGLRVLSQRPVDVLGQGLDSLQGLVRAAEELEGAPRSQLHYLVEQLPRGRALSELAFAELPPDVRGQLCEAGVKALWRRADVAWLTELLDLVEIVEIPHLGRSAERARTEREAAHV